MFFVVVVDFFFFGGEEELLHRGFWASGRFLRCRYFLYVFFFILRGVRRPTEEYCVAEGAPREKQTLMRLKKITHKK